MKLKVIVPTYNSAPWIEACLRSIATQRFQNYECLVIDDASTDGTFEVASNLSFLDDRFTVMRNPQNIGPLANTWHGFRRVGCADDPEAVLTIIDGDDRLAHDGAFSVIESAYDSDKNLLMTYGNYADMNQPNIGRCGDFPQHIIDKRAFRSYPEACVSCLRTFKARLWNAIKREDLCEPGTSSFFKAGGDSVYCLAALDMAGSRFKFIRDIIYYYNTHNPLSDSRIRNVEQKRVDNLVRRYATYPLLP